MLQLKTRSIVAAPQTSAENKQPRRLLMALAVLIILLAAILVRDSEFWFNSETSSLDADSTPTTSSQPVSSSTKAVVNAPAAKTVAPSVEAKKPATATTTVSKAETPAAPAEPSATINRTVLPPLEIDVVAGDRHSRIRPGSNAIQIQTDAATAAELKKDAADRERIVPGQGSSQAAYPALAQHMNVQGSVVLQALIGANGMIENLHVLSGPSILTAAAQQAVREWHFKPYLLNGQPVETKATITVNFTIKVDGSSKNVESAASGF